MLVVHKLGYLLGTAEDVRRRPHFFYFPDNNAQRADLTWIDFDEIIDEPNEGEGTKRMRSMRVVSRDYSIVGDCV